MNSSKSSLLLLIVGLVPGSLTAQVVLSGTSYSEDFDDLGSGLPSGWSVTTNASPSGLGDSSSITTSAVRWGAANSSGLFRNSSSSSIDSSSSTDDQSANSDRALGWRPSLAAERDGAILLTVQNTLGLENFNLSLSVFTFNDVAASATYALEYGVGEAGNFTQVGSTYNTGTEFSQTDYSVNSVTLSAMNDQSDTVYIRLRGTTSSGTGALDGVGIDNFSLTYSAVPEPSSFAALIGLGALGMVATRRRRQKPAGALSA